MQVNIPEIIYVCTVKLCIYISYIFYIEFHIHITDLYMGDSQNRGTPNSSMLIGFSIINHPFWGTTIF